MRSRATLIIGLLIAPLFWAATVQAASESDRPVEPLYGVCPRDPIGIAMPHTGSIPGKGVVSGTLACNTGHSIEKCPCKQCQFFDVTFRFGILDNLYALNRVRAPNERGQPDNPVEAWLRANPCRTNTSAPQPPPVQPPPRPREPAGYPRMKLNGGDRADCDLISPEKRTEEEGRLRSRCEELLNARVNGSGSCKDYMERRLRQGGHSWSGQVEGPAMCVLLNSMDRLTELERTQIIGGGSMDRPRATDADREDCRLIAENDSTNRGLCANRINRMINRLRGADKQCQSYFAARFRQGSTCPTGEWSNTTLRSPPAPVNPSRTGRPADN